MSPTTVHARHGAYVQLSTSQCLQITNPSGNQVVDLWAFPISTEVPKWLSVSQSRQKLGRARPVLGSTFVDTHRKPVLTLVKDKSPGVHDMLYPGCDDHRYSENGVPDHGSCAQNLRTELSAFVSSRHSEDGNIMALRELEAKIQSWGWIPEPLNIFMNVSVGKEKKGEEEQEMVLNVRRPVCKAGDYVVLRADVECLVVMSACPNDLLDTNGGQPGDAVYEVYTQPDKLP